VEKPEPSLAIAIRRDLRDSPATANLFGLQGAAARVGSARRTEQRTGVPVLTQSRDLAEGGNDISPRIGGISGAAIGAIVSTLIDDAAHPVIGLFHEPVELSNLASVPSNPNSVPVQALRSRDQGMSNIGLFINAVVNSSVSPLVCFSSSRALTV